MIDPAGYYGLPKIVPATAPSTAAAPEGGPTVAVTRPGLHQDPVFVLVGFLLVAFLLARVAEHGISLGFRLTAR